MHFLLDVLQKFKFHNLSMWFSQIIWENLHNEGEEKREKREKKANLRRLFFFAFMMKVSSLHLHFLGSCNLLPVE